MAMYSDTQKSIPSPSSAPRNLLTSPEPEQPTSTDPDDENNRPTCFETFAYVISIILVILTFPISIAFCVRCAYEYERVIIFRLGKLRKGARGPGIYIILPCIDDFRIVDLRTETFDVYPQDVLTKDNVSIRLDAVVFFRVYDPKLGVIRIGNYKYSTMLLAQTTLRNIAGTKTLGELLTEREQISDEIRQILDSGTKHWGIKVERVEIKDVRLPESMQRSMAAEAEANREARAKIIAADGEKDAANALREASRIISVNPAAVQLRYLQTLHTIAIDKSSTIVIPVPKEFMKLCMK